MTGVKAVSGGGSEGAGGDDVEGGQGGEGGGGLGTHWKPLKTRTRGGQWQE